MNAVEVGSLRATILSIPITAALSAVSSGAGYTPLTGAGGARYLECQAKFVYGSGGTTVKVWIQTSLDGGVTWFDIANFAFTTASGNKLHSIVQEPATPFTAGTVPASATLADNTILNGMLGDRFRALVTTTGTYGGTTTLTVDVLAKG